MGLNKFIFVLTVLLQSCRGEIFSIQPSNRLVPKGSTADVIFNCKAGDELTNPNYRWRKNDQELADEGRYQVYGGNLHISQPQDGDEGSYQCVIQSDQGIVGSSIADLVFQYLNNYPPTGAKQMTIPASQGVMLECGEVDYYPKYSVFYYWDEVINFKRIGPAGNSDAYVSQKTGNMYFSNPQTSDSGEYQCTARTREKLNINFVSTQAESVNLKVDSSVAEYEPRFLLQPEPVTFAELGKYALIECFATGNPTPENTWTFEGGPLPSAVEVTEGGQLLFNVVRKDMEGTYRCAAVNSLGEAAAEGALELQYPPKWTKEISSEGADLTSTVSWDCAADAAPVATYSWWKNGQPLLTEDDPSVTIIYADGSTTLMIMNLDQKHSGMYQCTAENKYGNAISSGHLQVNSYAPSITDFPALTYAALDSPITIPCDHTAAPAAEIIWYKDDASISEGEKYHFGDDGSVTINDVEKSDEGLYRCYATNQLGDDDGEGTLKAYEPTVLTSSPSDVDVEVGDAAEMRCAATNDPQLQLNWVWYHDDEMLMQTLDSPYSMNAGQLEIKAATSKEAGVYRCCADTKVGTPCASAEAVVTAPPDSPSGIALMSATSTSQKLIWKEPFDNHSPITHYTVEVKDSYNEEWTEAETDPSNIDTANCTVVELYPYNDYNYRIYAHNDLGASEGSAPSAAFATKKGAPKKAPSRLRGGSTVLGELTITWEPLNEEYFGDDDVDYVLAIQKMRAVHLPLPIPNNNTTQGGAVEDPWIKTTIQDEKQSNYTFQVNKSEIYVPYTVQIRADNEMGEGPWSRPRTVHTAEIKPVEQPTGVKIKSMEAHMMKIQWDSLESKNGRIQGYFVKVTPKAGPPASEILQKTKSIVPIIRIDGLSSSTVYEVLVSGYNTAGQGPWSQQQFFNTPKKAPQHAPKEVKLSVKSTTISASWKPITGMGMDEATLKGYKVQYWFSNRTSKSAVTHTTEFTTINFNVPNNSLFNVWVRGYSAGGDGVPTPPFYVSTQSASKAGYISCCGADAITFNISIIISISLLWLLFSKLNV